VTVPIDDYSSCDKVMIYGPPRGMALGKTGWNSFTAAGFFFPLLRSLDRKRLIVSVYLQDGLFSAAFQRHMVAKHRLYYKVMSDGDAEDDMDLATYKDHISDIAFAMKCVAHIFSNAIKWGLWQHHSKDVLQAFHIKMISILNGSSYLLDAVALFIVTKAHFKADDGVSVKDINTFWSFLDVREKFLQQCTDLNPCFDGTFLNIRAHAEHMPIVMDNIATCVSYGVQGARFCQTRWAGVGQTCRKHIRAKALGTYLHTKIAIKQHNTHIYI
jgi:hypothetical protein